VDFRFAVGATTIRDSGAVVIGAQGSHPSPIVNGMDCGASGDDRPGADGA
jgi:hypothetical protein